MTRTPQKDKGRRTNERNGRNQRDKNRREKQQQQKNLKTGSGFVFRVMSAVTEKDFFGMTRRQKKTILGGPARDLGLFQFC